MEERQDYTKEKKELRKQILTLRNEMPHTVREEKSHKIRRTLMESKLYQEADILLTYVEYQSEVITTPLIAQACAFGKQIFAPKVFGEEMEFYRIDGIQNLTKGYHGIREPMSGQVFLEETDRLYGRDVPNLPKEPNTPKPPKILILMPGAVFDEKRHRIGYGKGFYDRYLLRLSERGIRARTVALCYECQILPQIPYETHDIMPEMILTEEKLYR